MDGKGDHQSSGRKVEKKTNEEQLARAVTKDATNSIEHVVEGRVPIDEQANDLSRLGLHPLYLSLVLTAALSE